MELKVCFTYQKEHHYVENSIKDEEKMQGWHSFASLWMRTTKSNLMGRHNDQQTHRLRTADGGYELPGGCLDSFSRRTPVQPREIK
jgi:hypothetical protein